MTLAEQVERLVAIPFESGLTVEPEAKHEMMLLLPEVAIPFESGLTVELRSSVDTWALNP